MKIQPRKHKAFTTLLRTTRTKKKLTQAQVQKKTGIQSTTISMLERGVGAYVADEKVARLAKFLRTSVPV